MNQYVTHEITEDMLPAIRCVVAKNAIGNSASYLLLWGLLNLIGWCLFSEQALDMLRRMRNPSVLAYLYVYGTLVIAAGMILFGLYGLASRHVSTILLDGITLASTGVWGISQRFLKAAALGARFAPSMASVIYSSVLGVMQIGWAVREVRRYHRFSEWQEAHCPEADIHAAEHTMSNCVKLPENWTLKRLKARRIRNLRRRTLFTGQVCGDMLILVSQRLSDLICIDRDTARAGRFEQNGEWHVLVDETPVRLILRRRSLALVKRWAGLPFTVADVKYIGTRPGGTLPIMEEIIETAGPDVGAAALAVVGRIRQPDAADLALAHVVSDTPLIRAAALQACTSLRVPTLQELAIVLIKDPSAAVRQAAGQYLAVFPTAAATRQLEFAAFAERDGRARAAFKKAHKRCAKMSV